MIKNPSQKQKELAEKLGIILNNQTQRVLSAEINDELERKSFKYVKDNKFIPGLKIIYIGKRKDMPKILIISTIAKNGYLYFKTTNKYCRPWDVKVA